MNSVGISDGMYSAEVGDCTNFIFVRVDSQVTDYWSYWNRTDDLYNDFTTYNCFEITGWENGDNSTDDKKHSGGEWTNVIFTRMNSASTDMN